MEEKGTTGTTNNDEEELRSCLNVSSREDKIELRLTSGRPVAVSGFARNLCRRCFFRTRGQSRQVATVHSLKTISNDSRDFPEDTRLKYLPCQSFDVFFTS